MTLSDPDTCRECLGQYIRMQTARCQNTILTKEYHLATKKKSGWYCAIGKNNVGRDFG
jgi:hypothetical protein